MERIEAEQEKKDDEISKDIVTSNIEMLLSYCLRFYNRQFESRVEMNNNILLDFDSELRQYMYSDKAEKYGFPLVSYFADKAHLSPNYFGDLVKKTTGKSAKVYIQSFMIDIAKERLTSTSLNINEIAISLGFQYPQHFTRFFRRMVGSSPRIYRMNKQ